MGNYKNITSWYVYLWSMTFMPCGIFMQRFCFVGVHPYTLPQTIVAYLQITFKVSEVRVDFFHCSQNSKRFLKTLQLHSYKLRTNGEYCIYINIIQKLRKWRESNQYNWQGKRLLSSYFTITV
jgi:hypothetical protein